MNYYQTYIIILASGGIMADTAVNTAVTTAEPTARRRGRQGGPPLLAPAIAYTVLTVAAVILSAKIPRPGAAAGSVLAYDRAHHTELEIAGFFVFGASAPLAIWAATIYRRLRTLGVTAPGAAIALAGGLLAAGSLALSGLFTWTASDVQSVAGPALARALADLSFVTGAAGFVVPFALLMAGVSVPSLILRFVPRWLSWAGLVVAAAGVLSTFTLLTSALDVLLPIGRFAGLVWLLAVSATMPHDRREVRAAAAAPAPPGRPAA
jgi:hypothetical protein